MRYHFLKQSTQHSFNVTDFWFASTHPLVPCSDQIPATGLWSNSFKSNPTGCSTADAATLFYAYNTPNGSSSNTGYGQSNTIVVYFVVDSNGDMSMVLTFDEPNDGSGGSVTLNVDAPNTAGMNIDFSVRDDATEPRYTNGGGMYLWNASGVNPGMRWNWASCCTDGGAISGFPSDGRQVPFSFDAVTGINQVKLVSSMLCPICSVGLQGRAVVGWLTVGGCARCHKMLSTELTHLLLSPFQYQGILELHY
jgi:hypothetical protein